MFKSSLLVHGDNLQIGRNIISPKSEIEGKYQCNIKSYLRVSTNLYVIFFSSRGQELRTEVHINMQEQF